MPAIKFPSVSNIDLTKFDLSKIVTNLHLPTIHPEPVIQFAKDAAYITIGAGVLAFQKTQVRRREITTAVQASMPKITHEAIAQAESVVSNIRTFVNTRFPKKSTPTTE
jgi:hypothetical protein